MEPVETILVPISKAAGCTIICEAELSQHCVCRQTAQTVAKALDHAGLCVVPKIRAANYVWTEDATPTPSRTEEGDGW